MGVRRNLTTTNLNPVLNTFLTLAQGPRGRGKRMTGIPKRRSLRMPTRRVWPQMEPGDLSACAAHTGGFGRARAAGFLPSEPARKLAFASFPSSLPAAGSGSACGAGAARRRRHVGAAAAAVAAAAASTPAVSALPSLSPPPLGLSVGGARCVRSRQPLCSSSASPRLGCPLRSLARLPAMATRSCREKAQKLNEQHQLILSKLLREEDNKYCADCEAKGPRWASWNIGVFICIRCAGIHRNLGVHISRVKSVNLDQWTPEQIQCMQDMGNTKARMLYEANLPENFRRPQTDQAVEFFIRDKYEKKKYYDKNAVTVTNPQKKEEQNLEFKKSTSPKKAAEPTIDLLGLDGPPEAPVTNGSTTTITTTLNDDLDIFGPMISNPLPATVIPPAQGPPTIPVAATLTAGSGDLDLFTEPTTKSEESAKKQLSKDSILSLYGTGTIQQPSAPGMFMGPSTLPFTSQAPTQFQGFPSMGVPVPAAPGIMGNMMGQSVPVMGQNASMMVGMAMPNGFVGNAQTGVMPLSQNVVGSQGGMVGQMGAAQNKFGIQQTQQPQWNLSQMNQQMAGMNITSASSAVGFGQPPNTTAGWSGSSSGQTLSTQLWK
uniref:Small ArfGAP 1 n=1 Tax=Monodelphis domestica TaxID=13616 RepID=A0A5F8HKT3_MONDO